MDQCKPKLKKRTIILTGFGPFGENQWNASSIAVKQLRDLWMTNTSLTRSPVELVTFEDVPVTYGDVARLSKRIWTLDPDLVVHVGLSAGSDEICLESQAFNGPYNLLDEEGKCLPGGPCLQQDNDHVNTCLSSQFDLAQTVKCVSGHSIPIQVSNDPGLYLCGYMYYLSLQQAKDRFIFVHVPPICPALNATSMASALFDIVRDLLSQRGVMDLANIELIS